MCVYEPSAYWSVNAIFCDIFFRKLLVQKAVSDKCKVAEPRVEWACFVCVCTYVCVFELPGLWSHSLSWN